MVTKSKDSGFSAASDARPKPVSLFRKGNGVKTLLPIICTHIFSGTRVMSDMWKAYRRVPKDEGCSHLTVNHVLNLVDPDKGARTQSIENTWRVVKRSMPRTGTYIQRLPRKLPTGIVVTCSFYHRMYCWFSDRHFMEERNKNTASSRESEFEERNQGEKSGVTREVSTNFIFVTLF